MYLISNLFYNYFRISKYSWHCRGTPVGEVNMSRYSSTTFSICCCHVEEPCLEVMAMILFFPWECIIKKTNFPVLEMSLLHCFAVTKEIATGGGTSSILYKLFPNVIITVRGRDSYTACRFHKYGWPNNTSQTSRGAISHNTSSVKGLML